MICILSCYLDPKRESRNPDPAKNGPGYETERSIFHVNLFTVLGTSLKEEAKIVCIADSHVMIKFTDHPVRKLSFNSKLNAE